MKFLSYILSRCWDSQAQLRTNWERDTGVKQMEMIKQLEECASGLQPSVTAHDGAWILQTCLLGHSQSKVVLTPAGAGYSRACYRAVLDTCFLQERKKSWWIWPGHFSNLTNQTTCPAEVRKRWREKLGSLSGDIPLPGNRVHMRSVVSNSWRPHGL